MNRHSVAEYNNTELDALTARVDGRAQLQGITFDGEGDCKPPAELIEGILVKEGIAFIGGQSGAGKTFLATEMSVCLAAQVPFFGRDVHERVGVLIIAAEGSQTFPARLAAARADRGLSPLPIAHMGITANLSDDREIDKLTTRIVALHRHMIDRYGLRLGAIIVDTVAASFVLGKTDANAEAAATCNRLNRIGASVGAVMIPVHHYGKDETTGLLGASGWRAGADVVLSVLCNRNHITGEAKNRQLCLAKHRSRPEGPVAMFELEFVGLGYDDDGKAYGSMRVAAKLDEPIVFKASRSVRHPRHLIAMREVFREACADDGEMQAIMGDGPRLRVVRLDQVRSRFRQRYVTGEEADKAGSTMRSAFSRAMGALDKIGLSTGAWADTEWIWSAREDGVAGVASVAE